MDESEQTLMLFGHGELAADECLGARQASERGGISDVALIEKKTDKSFC